MNNLGKKITGFPQNQAQMAEWQKKYTFSGGSWYEKPTAVSATTTTTVDTTSQYIQDPNNPYASIPNPNYKPPTAPTTPTTTGITGGEEVTPEVTPEVAPEPTVGVTEPVKEGAEVDLNQQLTNAINEKDIQQIINLHAQMGLEYPSDLITALATPEKPEADIREEVYEKYDIDTLQKDWETKPTQSFEEIFEDVYEKLGLIDLKTEIDDLRKKIADREEKRDETIAKIYDDPWLPMASLTGRIKRVDDKFQRELSRLTNQLTLVDTMYRRGKEEATNVATRALNQYSKERQYAGEELAYYLEKAEADVEAKTRAGEEEAEREKWRYYPEYLEESAGRPEGSEYERRKQELDIATREKALAKPYWKPEGEGEGKKWTKDEIGSYIQRRISEDEGWATIAKELEDRGVPTYTGSTADKLLNQMFGGGEESEKESEVEGDAVDKILKEYGF